MVPKIIHYCWFGNNDKPESVLKCIESWKKYLPDYEIKEWNEENFPIEEQNEYVQEAYEYKKWAFVSDVARLYALNVEGGIYFDTDIEVFQSFDSLLDQSFFACFESKDYVSTAVIGSEKGNIFIQDFMHQYSMRHFIGSDGLPTIDITNVMIMASLLQEYGFEMNGQQQSIDHMTLYPQYYFASNDFRNIFDHYDKRIYAYHHCQASWYEQARSNDHLDLFKHYLVGKLRNFVGTETLKNIKKMFK